MKRSVAQRPIIQILLVIYPLWYVYVSVHNLWTYFLSNWFMPLTMIVGSFVAGSTPFGGGSVAFPVMTLIFDIDPIVARDFSVAIQSIGMLSATYTILYMRIKVLDFKSICLFCLGGIIGLIMGMYGIAPLCSDTFIKIIFSSLWFSFGLVFYYVNRKSVKNNIYTDISHPDLRKKLQMIFFGYLGGVVTGLTGSGIDTVVFIFLVLRFGIREKVAIPTTVILMTILSIVAVTVRMIELNGIDNEVFGYWIVSVPAVAVGAPFGAWFVNKVSRNITNNLLYCLIAVQYVGILLKFKLDLYIVTVSAIIIVSGFLGFYSMSKKIICNESEKVTAVK